MEAILLRQTNPESDFKDIASLISSQEDVPTSQEALQKDYERNKANILRLMTAMDQQGNLMGFTWLFREKADPDMASFFLVIKPECRRRGAGRILYLDLLEAANQARLKRLRFSLPDSCLEDREFAERRGFCEIRYDFTMELDLDGFDDRPYDAVLERLRQEGFQFTSMAELGNTQEAQRKLYALNDAASASTLGQRGEHAWASFEDFQQRVCGADWYQPAGQIIAIDTGNGLWVAMSAITRMAGREYAYNLFTGVDIPYRGRKLAQAVKVLALRYAHSHLEVKTVRTHHNTQNLPMIAIDKKFGYRQLPGSWLMEKVLKEDSSKT